RDGDGKAVAVAPGQDGRVRRSGGPAPGGVALPPFRNEPVSNFAWAEPRERMARAIEEVRAGLGGRHPLVIGDDVVETDDVIVSVNPSYPAEVIGTAGRARGEHVDRAVEAARKAFPAWRDAGAEKRVDILLRAAAIMRRRRYELAALVCLENGKPWREADADVTEAIDFLEYYARQALSLAAPIPMPHLAGERNHTVYEPRGVAAVIAPWNFPLAILTGMSSAALAVGN